MKQYERLESSQQQENFQQLKYPSNGHSSIT